MPVFFCFVNPSLYLFHFGSITVQSPFFADCRNRMASMSDAGYTCFMLRVKLKAVHVSYA